MALAITTRSSFPHSHSLPSGSFHKPHPYPSEGRQNENQNHRKLINWSHGPQPGLTQWNYEPCHVGPPKKDESWWIVLIIHGPLEKGMANHFSILALRTSWTVWPGIIRGIYSSSWSRPLKEPATLHWSLLSAISYPLLFTVLPFLPAY